MAIALLMPLDGHCTEELREFRGTALPLAISKDFQLEVIPAGHSSLEAATRAMLEGFSLTTALRITPNADFGNFVVLVSSGWVESSSGLQAATQVLLVNPVGTVFSLPVNTAGGNGALQRICIFPDQVKPASCLILLSFSQGSNSPVIGFGLDRDGQLWNLDCHSAKTLFGWFEVKDLNGDGSFDLLTTRSLDGVPGGFSYSAVRAYQAEDLAFHPDPDSYRVHFEEELAWLEWVVATAETIQMDPDGFVSPMEQGPFFVASYAGKKFGFDSIVELPVPEGNYIHLEQFNAERRVSFNLVQRYYSELQSWLGGGPYPLSWKLAK